MATKDYSPRAAAIADELIARSDGVLGPKDRDPVRVVLRIAFEVNDFLGGDRNQAESREWNQDTVFSGCDSIQRARSVWRELGCFDGLSLPGPGADTFPGDLAEVHKQLDDALRLIQNESVPLGARLRAVNRIARLQIIFLGATLW